MAKAATIRGVHPETPTSTALVRAVGMRMRELDRQLVKLGRALGDEPVHDTRVAVRRLRAALRAFGAVDDLRTADREAKRLQDALGDLRDRHVRKAWLVCQGAAHLAAREDRGIKGAEARLRVALRAWRARGRARVLGDVSGWEGLQSVGDVAAARLARRRRRVKRARRAVHDEPTPETFHALRIAFKKLRYETECYASAEPDRTERLLEELAPLQELLGELHDADVRRAWLEEKAPTKEVLALVQSEREERRRLRKAVESALEGAHVERAVKKLARALSSAAGG